MQTKVIPVIHYASDAQALRNAERAFDAGCAGLFLIHMEGENNLLPAVARKIKALWPDKLIGINFLGAEPADAIKSNIEIGLDMTWTDEQLTHSANAPWDRAERARDVLSRHPEHLLFVGVAFKHQRHDPAPEKAAQKACEFGFIPTTSGVATGVAAEAGKITSLRSAIGKTAPLAIASGITPDNVAQVAPYLTHILVATGVSSSFYEFDYEKLHCLRALCDRELLEKTLKPCSCGGKQSDVGFSQNEGSGKHFVLCGNCGHAGPADASLAVAADQWNELDHDTLVK